jgi:hypothetical protein
VHSGSDVSLKAYASGSSLQVVANFEADLWIDEHRPFLTERFYVIKGARRALLSRETAIRYSVLQVGLSVQVQEIRSSMFYDSLTRSSLQIGAIESPKAYPKFAMLPVKLVRRYTYTNIPLVWKDEARRRIQSLLDSDIIEKVVDGMDRDHCSSMLAVTKGGIQTWKWVSRC